MKSFSDLNKFKFNLLWMSEHFLGSKISQFIFGTTKDKYAFQFSNNDYEEIQIKEISNFNSIEDFKNNYLRQNKPVILRGAAKMWPAISKWSLDYFSDNYGNVHQYKINTSGKEILDQKNNNEEIVSSNIKEVITNIKEGKKQYANFNPILHFFPELLNDVSLKWIFNLADFFTPDRMYQLFIGGKNTGTELHCAISSNIFVQIHGKKKWYLVHPKYSPLLNVRVSREPCFHSDFDFRTQKEKANFPFMEFELEPGDVFFNPPFYWHQVINTEDSIGLAVKWNCFYRFFNVSFTKTILTTFAINPPIWKVLGGPGRYLSIFTNKRKIKA